MTSIDLFRQKAEAVSAVVVEAKNAAEAIDYVIDLCDKKEVCQLLMSGCELPVSDKAEALCNEKQQKIICAPALDKRTFNALKKKCEKHGFKLISEGMRNHLAGIDIGLTYAEKGVADTGTLVVPSASEEVRLATMIAEIHVALLPKSAIVPSTAEVEEYLLENMKGGPDYHAFITGPSRTADIERVLALGVHGPLDLHIVLLED